MPLYEYRCKNCGHQFEIQQSMSEDSLTVCPSCEEAELRKVFQPVGITFKGTGFYKNDSRSSSSSSTASGTSSSGTASSGSDSSGDSSGSSDSSSGSSSSTAASTSTASPSTSSSSSSD
ncbi:MAG: FmdB family zinc ribbon protein [Microthrixaceae bacterium]